MLLTVGYKHTTCWYWICNGWLATFSMKNQEKSTMRCLRRERCLERVTTRPDLMMSDIMFLHRRELVRTTIISSVRIFFWTHDYPDPFYFQGQMEAKLKLTHQGRRRKEIFLLNFCRTKFLTTTTTKYRGSRNSHPRKIPDNLRLRLLLLTMVLAADWRPGDTCPGQ